MIVSILTIITVHLNDFEGLSRTYESIRSRLSTSDVEWIVIDGGSNIQSTEQRESLSLAQNYANHFVSEPDNGIYDAMNKGTRLAISEYVLYLNAGDKLHPDFSFETFAEAISGLDASMLWCRADVRDRTGKVYPRKTRQPVWLRYGTAVCHQAVFFRRPALGFNPYEMKYSVAGDYDLICRLYTSGARIELLDIPVCIFDLIGKSGTDKRLTLTEESEIRQQYFPIPEFVNRAILEFKYLVWQTGTFLPSFRRAWSRFF
jgi:putative colanic acid biosynthesis glycosyltransferase